MRWHEDRILSKVSASYWVLIKIPKLIPSHVEFCILERQQRRRELREESEEEKKKKNSSDYGKATNSQFWGNNKLTRLPEFLLEVYLSPKQCSSSLWDPSVHPPNRVPTILCEFIHHQRTPQDNIETSSHEPCTPGKQRLPKNYFSPFCVSGNSLPAQSNASPCDLDKTHWWPLVTYDKTKIYPPNSYSFTHKWLAELFVSIDHSDWSTVLNCSWPNFSKAFLLFSSLWTLTHSWAMEGGQSFLNDPSQESADLREEYSLINCPVTPSTHPSLPHPILFSLFTSPYKRKALFCLTFEMLIDLLVKVVLLLPYPPPPITIVLFPLL